MFLLLVITILGVALFVYLKSQDIDLKNISIRDLMENNLLIQGREAVGKKTFEMKYDTKDHTALSVYNNSVIICTGDSVKSFSDEGTEQWSIPVTINNPLLKTAGPYLLVADMGGKDIYVISGRGIKWSKKLDSNIINADISECGYVSVVQEAKGYKAAVTAFNLQGSPFFTRTIAENYIISARVSPSGKQVLINGVDASGIKAGASLEFTDILGTPLAGKIPKEDVIFSSAWYLDNDYVLAISDSLVLCLDKNRNEKWKQDFAGRKVYSSGVAQGKYAVVAVSGRDKPGVFDGNASELKIFNANGQQGAVCPIDADVENIGICSDMIAVNTGREVYFINTKGKLIGKYASKIDIIEASFLSRKSAAIITKGSVVVYKM